MDRRIRFLVVVLLFSFCSLGSARADHRILSFGALHEVEAPSADPVVTEELFRACTSALDLEVESDRRAALKDLVVYRHRRAFAHLREEQLVALVALGDDCFRMTLLLLNHHWLRHRPDLAGLFPAGTFEGLPAFLAARGLAADECTVVPTLAELEARFAFDADALEPLSRSALEYFLVGHVYPHELVYYFSMEGSSTWTDVARRIVAYMKPRDPEHLGLELLCDFELASIPFQPQTILVKYLYGRIRRDTFQSWFGLAHQPALLERILAATAPRPARVQSRGFLKTTTSRTMDSLMRWGAAKGRVARPSPSKSSTSSTLRGW